jgi:hypothetical protein
MLVLLDSWDIGIFCLTLAQYFTNPTWTLMANEPSREAAANEPSWFQDRRSKYNAVIAPFLTRGASDRLIWQAL